MVKQKNNYSFFLYTAGTATAGIAAVLFLFWQLLMPGIHLYAPLFDKGVNLFFSLVLLTNIGLYGMLWVYSSRSDIRMRWLDRSIALYLRLIYEPTCILARFVGLQRERVTRAYIEFLNHLAKLRNIRVSAERILILAPHCLQWDKCPHKITRNIDNCHQCGQCPIGTIVVLSRASGCHFAVATGGTLARQIVRELRPLAIIAIACERDLVSGMQDVFPLPVLGLLNERPNGPCFNTQVDIHVLKELLESMTGEHYECT